MKVKALLTAILLAGTAASAFAHGNLADVVARGEREHALEMIAEGSDVNTLLSDGTSALVYAAHQGDAELVAALLKAGADVSQTNEYGAYALSEATIAKSDEVISLLLEHGADADQKNPEGETPLMIAARNGDLDAAALLLKHGADVNARETWGGQSPVMWAAAQKHPEMIALLAKHGADVNAQSAIRLWDRRTTSEPRPKDMNKGGFYPLHYAARQACIACIEELVKAGAELEVTDPDRVSPLNLALINQHFDAAAKLIEVGANVDSWDLYGRTPLFNAVDLNTTPTGGRTDIPSDDFLTGVDIARMLLERGADPNIQLKLRPPYRNVPFDRGADNVISTGATALLRAARAADNESVKVLLEYGALPDLPNARGQTPMMIVSGMDYPDNPTRGRYKTQEDSIETIRLLIEAGAQVNSLTGDPTRPDGTLQGGQTALHAAARQGWDQIIQYLIDNGAAQEVEDSSGNTPIDYAMGRFGAGFLQARPEPKLATAKLLQDNCMASDNCTLEEVIEFPENESVN